MTLILYCGTPRTATTSLQKHVFPRIINYLCIHKQPYSFSREAIQGLPGSFSSTPNAVGVDMHSLKLSIKFLNDASVIDENWRNSTFAILRYLSSALGIRSCKQAKVYHALLSEALAMARRAARNYPMRGIIYATEGLSNTTFPLTCDPAVLTTTEKLPVEVIANAWSDMAENGEVRIVFCLRDPLEHITSRYLRYKHNKTRSKLSHAIVGEQEWIMRQCKAYNDNPVCSAFFPCFHMEFVKFHHRLGFVRSVGFQDIIHSSDILSALGLNERARINIAKAMPENSAGVDAVTRHETLSKIKEALGQSGYLEKMYMQQMHA